MTPEKKRTVKEKAKDYTMIVSIIGLLTNTGYDKLIKEDSNVKESVRIEVAKQMDVSCQRLVLLEKSDAVQNVQITGLTSSVTSMGVKQDNIYNILLTLKNN